MKRGKKYNQGFEKLEAEKAYGLAESLNLLKEIANKNFDETVELHIRLSVDPKKANQMVRGTVVLPHGTGKDVKVLVFAEGDKVDEAKMPAQTLLVWMISQKRSRVVGQISMLQLRPPI